MGNRSSLSDIDVADSVRSKIGVGLRWRRWRNIPAKWDLSWRNLMSNLPSSVRPNLLTDILRNIQGPSLRNIPKTRTPVFKPSSQNLALFRRSGISARILSDQVLFLFLRLGAVGAMNNGQWVPNELLL